MEYACEVLISTPKHNKIWVRSSKLHDQLENFDAKGFFFSFFFHWNLEAFFLPPFWIFLKPRAFIFSSFSTWAERWQTHLFFSKEACDCPGNTRFQQAVASRKPAMVRAGSVRNVSKYDSSPLTTVQKEAEEDIKRIARGRRMAAPQGLVAPGSMGPVGPASSCCRGAGVLRPSVLLGHPQYDFLSHFCFYVRHLPFKKGDSWPVCRVGGLAVPERGLGVTATSWKGKTNETFLTGQKCVNCWQNDTCN